MIEALYRIPAPDGALLLLARLYDDVEDQAAVAAWEEGNTDLPPFCWRLAGNDYKPLQDALHRGRSAVTSHLAVLTKLNIIRRAKRDGRSGWELLGTRPAPASENSDGSVRGSGRPGPKILTATSGSTDVQPAPSVRIPGPGGPPARTSASGSPDAARAHEGIKQEPDLARRGGAANDRPAQGSASPTATSPTTAAPPARSPTRAEPPRPAPPTGPARTLLLDLVRQFDGEFTVISLEGVVLESRRIRPDAETLRRLAELLTPPEDVDGPAWLEREVASVTAYVRDYAKICAADPEQARQWGGDMFETRIRKGVRSAWDTLTRIVDRWREAQAVARAGARALAEDTRRADAAALAERLAELEQLAGRGETPGEREARLLLKLPARDHAADHRAALDLVRAGQQRGRPPTLAELNAAVAAVPAIVEPVATPLPELPAMQRTEPGRPPLTEEDEEQLRERGRQREAAAARGPAPRAAVTDPQALTSVRLAVAEFRRLMRRDPTRAELEEINRRARGEEDTGT